MISKLRVGSSTSPGIAVIAGATGLIGSRLLAMMAAEPDYVRIIALSRRPLALESPKVEVRAADFGRLGDLLGDLAQARAAIDVFCCLGTTIKVAGSEEAFRRVDHDYVLALARWAKSANVHRFLLVSALGADATSRVFYNRVKGETEAALGALGLQSLVVAQPSLLDGDREQSRPGERLAILVTRPIRRLLPASVRPVRAEDVAAALLLAARETQPPRVLTSAAMQRATERLLGA